MEIALVLVALVVVVAAATGLSRRFGASPPLVLLVVGVLASYVPGVPSVELNPEVVLFGFLPPLLYAAAIRTSLVDFRANRDALLLLSVGLVVFTTVSVGLVAWWVVPGVTLAAALALGAVVAPPDAVAATAIARQVGMPRRIVSVLEGESLVNDATALVALNTTIAAIAGTIGPTEIGLDFVVAVVGGVVIGLAAATLLAAVRKRVDDPVLDTVLSFVAPFVAFLPAEAIHASGVLAVVVTGLVLGHKSPVLQSGRSRLAEQINWATVQLVLENLVFLLIGLQLRDILAAIPGDLGWPRVMTVCLSVLLATVLTRFAWVFGAAWVYKHGTARMRARSWSWSMALVVSWAGMRGVVTLAAAFLLPADTPQRPLLVLVAFAVVAGTLLVQGLSLPTLVRRLRLPPPDAAEDALQEAELVTSATRAGLLRLDEVTGPEVSDEVVQALRHRATTRVNLAWEQLGRGHSDVEPPSVTYRRLRLQMLEAERGTVVAARDAGTTDNEVLRRAMLAIDVEESLLDRVEDTQVQEGRELVAPEQGRELCAHLEEAPRVLRPQTPGECADCRREGTDWVHLRLCLTCGVVGCCDSSPRRHMSAHHAGTRHPVMRSVEPGEAWRWCYVDEQLG